MKRIKRIAERRQIVLNSADDFENLPPKEKLVEYER